MKRAAGAGGLAAAVALALLVAGAAMAGAALAGPPEAAARRERLEALGESLFFDADLSRNRTQSCATCHDPARGFVDPRTGGAGGAVSVGDDGTSLGVRNAPTVAYAASSPTFGRRADGAFVGGQFLDGRADTLQAQAGQPILNPVEMAMPDKASVVARLKEKPAYVEAFRALFGPGVFGTTAGAYDALSQALAAYERSAAVSPFDSKYDRFLRGEAKLTDQEELGRVLFFSNQFTNCHLCHKLTPSGGAGETFSDYRFHNIGVPANAGLKAPVDHGLLQRPGITGRRHDGQFRVPTLRNVAVTGPYMHNGVFKDLRTVILFYNKFNSSAPERQVNPETGREWGRPEVPGTLSLKELETGPALDDRRIDALVAFLKTLTDRRYEPLLAP
ncbi:cytochrome-c peroxidase [Xanthobacter sp. AM11]|uniref:cytochrome-c peroxidase n=1 Tax=Xanthobacter sp. AM11 TaxID=3380643 RepID=UPI0039BF624D